MPVTERLQSLGQWQLTLRADTPKQVRDQISAPFASLIITPSWVESAGMSDASMLDIAVYNGVVLRPGPQFELGGVGLAWWLGDDKGVPYLASPVSSSGATLSSWVTSLLANVNGVDTVGSVTGAGPVGGTIGAYFRWQSARAALEAIFKYFQVEYRVNPDYTVDYGEPADLYTSNAVASALPRGQGGRELGLKGFRVTDIDYSRDFTDFLSFVTASGRGGVGQSASVSISSEFGANDPDGDPISRRAFFDAPDAALGFETNYAQTVADRYFDVDFVSLSTDDFVRGTFGPGYYINVYDPDRGLLDADNQDIYQGEVIFPKKVRVVGMSWPIQQGVGVYYRTHAASPATTVTYVDLTPYVEWERPGTRIDVGNVAYTPLAEQFSISAQTATVQAAAWDTYTPSWTGSGSNPAIGNGSITGAYRREGTRLHVRGKITMGSTTTYGTGTWSVSLPSGVTGVTDTNLEQVGTAWFNDTGTFRYAGSCYVGSGGTTITFQAFRYDPTLGAVAYAGWADVTSAIPHTWANTDFLSWSITLEVAP